MAATKGGAVSHADVVAILGEDPELQAQPNRVERCKFCFAEMGKNDFQFGLPSGKQLLCRACAMFVYQTVRMVEAYGKYVEPETILLPSGPEPILCKVDKPNLFVRFWRWIRGI